MSAFRSPQGRGELEQEPSGSFSPLSYVGLGFELALSLVLFMYAGHKLDGWLGTEPWLLMGGGLLGIAVGFYGLMRRLLKLVRPRGERGPG